MFLGIPSLEDVIGGVCDALGGARFHGSPEVRFEKVERLYRNAKRDQWNLDDRRDRYFAGAADGLGVSVEQAGALARLFSSFYYGERGAQIISSELVGMVPDVEASKFLATQVVDEARHVEVFEGILGAIGRIHPMNPFLNALLTDMSRAAHREEKLIGMNMLVEGLALSVFRAACKTLRHGLRVPEATYRAIGEPIEAILRDESRHVGFAVIYLPDLIRTSSLRRRAEIRLRQLVWLGLLYGSLKYQQRDQETIGVDHIAVLEEVLADHEERLAEVGGDVLVSTEKMKRFVPAVDRLVDKLLRRRAA
ncbi:MAG TPA: hypothetical protein VHF22_07510 [Planctomycetota bacterium]|nr:hypothetical protein [Planctomycetota bacterium]